MFISILGNHCDIYIITWKCNKTKTPSRAKLVANQFPKPILTFTLFAAI